MPKQAAMWLLRRLAPLALLLAAIWVVEGIQLASDRGLTPVFGLLPRHVSGLDGIVFMPFLHGSVEHAASNSVPLIILGALIALTATRALWAVNVVIVALGGLGVWLFGQEAYHIGASGLLFGWFGFLMARGVVDRRPLPFFVSVGVGVVYGTLIWGVLPGQEGISWEAHLFGALAGVAAAIVVPCRLTSARHAAERAGAPG